MRETATKNVINFEVWYKTQITEAIISILNKTVALSVDTKFISLF